MLHTQEVAVTTRIRVAIGLGVAAVVVAVVGIVMFNSTVTTTGSTGTITCGTAASPDSNQAYHDGLVKTFTQTQSGVTPSESYAAFNQSACDEATNTQATWSWVVIGLAVAALVAAGLTAAPEARPRPAAQA